MRSNASVVACSVGLLTAAMALCVPMGGWAADRPCASVPSVFAAIVDRASTRLHVAGELSGHGSARDAQAHAALRGAACGTMGNEVATLRRTHPANRAVIDALDAALSP